MCSKACPTDCITFGYLEDLREIAERRVEEYNRMKPEGAHPAWIYDERDGLEGMGVFYVLDAPIDVYEGPTIPREPKVPASVTVWKAVLRPLGWLSILGAALGAVVHYVAYGPKQVPEGPTADAETEPTPTAAGADPDGPAATRDRPEGP